MKSRLCILDCQKNTSEEISALIYSISCAFEIHVFSDFSSIKDTKFHLYIINIDTVNADCFTVVNQIQNINPVCHIILFSSHEELIFESYNYRILYFIRTAHLYADLINALMKYNQLKVNLNYIYRFRGSINPIPVTDIICITVNNNDSYIHTVNQDYHEHRPLKQILSELMDDQFIRISMNTAVNALHIKTIEKDFILMSNERKAYFSRERYPEIIDRYEKYKLLYPGEDKEKA